jgi:hypothetical protein
LGKNLIWMWLNIWWGKNVNQECIFSCGSLHESFCSNEQRLGASRLSCTIEVSLLGRSTIRWTVWTIIVVVFMDSYLTLILSKY